MRGPHGQRTGLALQSTDGAPLTRIARCLDPQRKAAAPLRRSQPAVTSTGPDASTHRRECARLGPQPRPLEVQVSPVITPVDIAGCACVKHNLGPRNQRCGPASAADGRAVERAIDLLDALAVGQEPLAIIRLSETGNSPAALRTVWLTSDPLPWCQNRRSPSLPATRVASRRSKLVAAQCKSAPVLTRLQHRGPG